jgi:stalled ribosome rescue protein Dom34
MISAAVWISLEEAKVFKFNPEGVEIHAIHSDHLKHKAEVDGRNHLKREGDAERFFHQVAEYLTKDSSARWLILGAGVAKTQFKHHIEKHHAQIANKIVGIEAIDKSTDGEIENFAHGFFRKHPQTLS